MKYLVTMLCALLIGAGVQAQEIKTLPSIVVTSGSNVNYAVIHSFRGHFKDAMDPIWYRMNKNYLVKFISKDQDNTALFKANGKLIYNISYGGEANLPEDIRGIVTGSYEDYKIVNAIHVSEAGRSIWVVNLEGLKKLILVRVEGGELEEVGNYVKS